MRTRRESSSAVRQHPSVLPAHSGQCGSLARLEHQRSAGTPRTVDETSLVVDAPVTVTLPDLVGRERFQPSTFKVSAVFTAHERH